LVEQKGLLMAHYYFDVKNGSTRRDHTGSEFASDGDAIARGQVIAYQFGTDCSQMDHDCHISVVREDGHEVMRVKVSGEAGLASAPRLKKFL
jgi:hypothetical protein